MRNIKLIDLSHTIKNNMPVFPGDEIVKIKQDKFIDKDGYNNFILNSSMHIGTHIDTPMHMVKSNETVNNYPLETFYGRGVLINAYGEKQINYSKYYETIIAENDIVLIYTGHSEVYNTKDYFENYPILSEELVKFFIQKKITLIGLDTPSPDKYPFPHHKLLLKNNILILENLCNLEELLGIFNFEVACFPLKIETDASLVRAVAIIR